MDADGAWYWCYFDPDEKTPGDAISAIASRMQPMTEAVRATFQSISARWDSESFLGPETHLILLRNMPTSLDADQLAQEFSCLEKGEPSDLLAYVVTLQDQVYSLIYFSEAVRAWVLRIAGLLCEEGCAEKPYVGFRLALSKLLPLDNWTIP